MRKAAIALALMVAGTAACTKTGENEYKVVTPGDVDVSVDKDTTTVRTPDVDIVRDSATIVTPDIDVKKDTSKVAVPKVRVKKPE